MSKQARPSLQILPPNSFQTQRWSGGTTTELFIFPEKSNYSQRNFEFRLSLATVEVETSDFTPLPGIFRKTMILDGEIALAHNGEAPEKLEKFDVASYDGGWQTHAVGQCTDFNLMTKGKTFGSLEGKALEPSEQWIVPTTEHTFLLVYQGRLAIIDQKEAHIAEEGSLVIAGKSVVPHLIVKAMTACELVLVRV
jgi:uncharacterized protein